MGEKSGMADALDYVLQNGEWTIWNDISLLLMFISLLLLLIFIIFLIIKKYYKLLVMTISLLLIGGSLAQAQISFSKIQDRPNKNITIPDKIREDFINKNFITDEEIVDYSIEMTASYLDFSEKNNILNKKANCIGYAKLCSSICNNLFQISGSKSKAKPVVGYVTLFGVNIHPFTQQMVPSKYKGFVKNHDFVEINYSNGKVIYIDPCVYDLLGNKLIVDVK